MINKLKGRLNSQQLQVLSFIFIILLLQIFVDRIPSNSNYEFEYKTIFRLLAAIVWFVMLYFAWNSIQNLISFSKPRLFPGISLGLAAFLVLQGVLTIVDSQLFVINEGVKTHIPATNPASGNWINGSSLIYVELALGGLLIPIVEEIIFRGILFNWLSTRTNVLGALVLSSIVFALCHVNWFSTDAIFQISIVYVAGLGLILGGLRLFTNDLVGCISFHCAWNLWGYYLIGF